MSQQKGEREMKCRRGDRGKGLLTALLAAIVLAGVCTPSGAESTATLNWEAQIDTGAVTCRGLAVDQSNGSIYVSTTVSGTVKPILKYDKDGNLLQTIPGSVYGGGSNTAGNTGLAVDPKTGYLYVCSNTGAKNIYVLDCTVSTPTASVRSFASTLGQLQLLAFSDDGQKLFVFGANTGGASDDDIGGKEFIRNDAGTPDVFTDDTFEPSGLVFDTDGQGVMPIANHGDVRGGTVDRLGNIYITDLHGSKRPIKRLRPSSNSLELEFYSYVTKSWGCDTDAANNFWLGDSADAANRRVRCYSSGIEIFSYDPGAGAPLSGQMQYCGMIACDRANGRVIVGGSNQVGSVAATKGLLQSWSVSVDSPALGTIAGKVVDAGTGTPVSTVSSITIESPYRYPTSYGVTFYGLTAPGTFSYQIMPSIYNVKVASPGYLNSGVSHYQVQAGLTTTTADIPMLFSTSDYVTIKLGEHNIEQGLFLRSTVPGAFVSNPDAGSSNFVANIGGRECRGFGRAESEGDEGHMIFNVDEGFNDKMAIWGFLEFDLFDDGPDRLSGELNTALDVKYTNLGVIVKGGSQTWKTMRFARDDFYCGNQIYTSGDFRFNSFPQDTLVPAGADYISQVTLRKTPTASTFTPIANIADLKTHILGQNATAEDKFSGGFPVKLLNQKVSAAWSGGNYFYIENADRTSGIRVYDSNWAGSFYDPKGYIVNIEGFVTSVPENQELAIRSRSEGLEVVSWGGDPFPITPLCTNGRSAGGGPIVGSQLVGETLYSYEFQPGITGGAGPTNVGLLAQITGKVVAVRTDALSSTTYAYIDDGSNVKSDTVEGVQMFGIRVLTDQLTVDQNVVVTGVISMGLYDPTPTQVSSGDEVRFPTLLMTDHRAL